jgi:hypothetical protein
MKNAPVLLEQLDAWNVSTRTTSGWYSFRMLLPPR